MQCAVLQTPRLVCEKYKFVAEVTGIRAWPKLGDFTLHRVPRPVYKYSKTSGAKSLLFREKMKNCSLAWWLAVLFFCFKNCCSNTVVRESLLGVPWDAHRSTGKVYDYCKKSNVCVSIPSVNKYDWPRLRLWLWWVFACTVSCDDPRWWIL